MRGWTTSLLLVCSPIIFFVSLVLARTGRDLTTVYFLGCGAFICLGVFVVTRRRRRQVSIFAGCGLIVVVLLTSFAACSGIYWIGTETREVIFSVRDAETAEPIANALVVLRQLYDENRVLNGQTDVQGRARIRKMFTSVGTDSALQRTGAIYLWQDNIEVDADGYQPLREPLDKFVGSGWDLYGAPLPVIEVTLKKKQ
jgi:hypothetical protein